MVRDSSQRILAAANPTSPQAGDRMNKRERSKIANRRAILEAARAAFAELGYQATTVRDIVRRTDLASGTFYNYFQSKEEIAAALESDSAARFAPLLRTQLARTDEDLRSIVHGAFHAFFAFLVAENSEDGRDAAAPLVGVRADTPETRAISDEVHALFETIIARGDVPPINVDYATAAAIGIAREIGHAMLLTKPRDARAAADFASGLLLDGLLGLGGQAR